MHVDLPVCVVFDTLKLIAGIVLGAAGYGVWGDVCVNMTWPQAQGTDREIAIGPSGI